MPRKGEKARKLKALSKGKGVRPPKKWWQKLYRKTKKQYGYGKARTAQIVGVIWSKATTSTKKKIVRKYQR